MQCRRSVFVQRHSRKIRLNFNDNLVDTWNLCHIQTPFDAFVNTILVDINNVHRYLDGDNTMLLSNLNCLGWNSNMFDQIESYWSKNMSNFWSQIDDITTLLRMLVELMMGMSTACANSCDYLFICCKHVQMYIGVGGCCLTSAKHETKFLNINCSQCVWCLVFWCNVNLAWARTPATDSVSDNLITFWYEMSLWAMHIFYGASNA